LPVNCQFDILADDGVPLNAHSRPARSAERKSGCGDRVQLNAAASGLRPSLPTPPSMIIRATVLSGDDFYSAPALVIFAGDGK
jgi:hypothetical protein